MSVWVIHHSSVCVCVSPYDEILEGPVIHTALSCFYPYSTLCLTQSHVYPEVCDSLFVRVCVTEASYTLLLYDELLEWSDRPLREFLNYPMQSEWHRKEYLHLTIVQNFDRGKVNLNTCLI